MRPTRLAVALATALIVLAVFLPDAWFIATGVLAVLFAAELAFAWLAPKVRVRRAVAGSLALGVKSRVRLVIANPSRRRAKLLVFDHAPARAELFAMPVTVVIAARNEVVLDYELRPLARGEQRFASTEVWRHGWLVARRMRVGHESLVRVYPNFAAVAAHALLARDDRIQQLGVKKRRRRGAGLSFLQLREFRDGDVLRQIDWKTTARRNRLISREYEEERDQQVLIVLDCGRRMHARDGELSHFDHALNALLLLSFVAQRQGDAVGVLTFAGPERFLPPTKGRVALRAILNVVHDLETTLAPADYVAAATRIVQRTKRRALVVWLTNVRDEDADDLAAAQALLAHRHLVLVASLRERALDEAATARVASLDDALRTAATWQYLEDRRRIAGRFLDVTPQQLAGAIVGRYLEIKRAGAL